MLKYTEQVDSVQKGDIKTLKRPRNCSCRSQSKQCPEIKVEKNIRIIKRPRNRVAVDRMEVPAQGGSGVT